MGSGILKKMEMLKQQDELIDTVSFHFDIFLQLSYSYAHHRDGHADLDLQGADEEESR